MTLRQIMSDIHIAPGTDPAIAIDRDIIGAPAGLHRAAKFRTIIERLKQVAWRVAFAAMFHRLDQVGSPIPVVTSIDVRFITLTRIEERRPYRHECALVERECQRVGGCGCMYRR